MHFFPYALHRSINTFEATPYDRIEQSSSGFSIRTRCRQLRKRQTAKFEIVVYTDESTQHEGECLRGEKEDTYESRVCVSVCLFVRRKKDKIKERCYSIFFKHCASLRSLAWNVPLPKEILRREYIIFRIKFVTTIAVEQENRHRVCVDPFPGGSIKVLK